MDDDDLTDDFLNSLDMLTVVTTTPPQQRQNAGKEGQTSSGDGEQTEDIDYRLSESRLSAFTAEELQHIESFRDDSTYPGRQSVIKEEQEEENETEQHIAKPEVNTPPMVNDGGQASDRMVRPHETEATLLPSAHEQNRTDAYRSQGGDYDQEDETGEYADEVSQLESSDIYGSFYSDSLLKASFPSYQSDVSDRSCSFASECTDFSPVHSPHEVTLDRATATYDQRLEASVHETASQHTGTMEESVDGDERHVSSHSHAPPTRPFTMEDIAYFDSHFGRDVFLEELGLAVVDGSGSRSLASYRMSSVYRISQTKSDVIKQGWLMKRGEFVRSWHKRWFTLRRMPQGPMLTYARDNSENAPAKLIDLSSTSRCVVGAKGAKEHEFRVLTSSDSSRREYACYAASNFELTEWVRAIQLAINAGNKSAFEGASDLQRIWNETGIQGFLLRYGMRKVSSRNHLQTRVLELNFADQTITNSRRGESLTTLHFNDLLRVSPTQQGAEEFGLVLDFNGKHRSWPLFLDTREARDDLLDIMQKIAIKEVIGEDLEARGSRLRLKSGFMERRHVGPQATLKGKLFVCLYENSAVFYPLGEDVSCSRPWYVVTLRGLPVACNEAKCLLTMGRLQLTCASVDECRQWFHAVRAATSLPPSVVELELRERAKIRNAFHRCVFRLRKLLKAGVKPEVNGPPRDQKTIELMMRELWALAFTGEPYTSNADPRWQELGFQRGGPASDLRSSGLLGLYCLIYFVTYPSGEFQRILTRTRHGVSDGNMKNYPLAIGCINVVAILIETLGLGDAGSHSAGCSPNAMRAFVRFIAQSVAERELTAPLRRQNSTRSGSLSGRPLELLESWDEIVGETDHHVFEHVFCILYPVLDALFVSMDAGYMEFGQVVAAFRRRLGAIFDAAPQTLEELQALAAEPVAHEALVAPSIIAKGMK